MTQNVNEEKFPNLEVTGNGTSGIEIRALPPKAFDCVEFRLRGDYPQTVMVGPWIQFEPIEMREWRFKLANEIARRAMLHDSLIREINDLQKQLEHERDAYERLQGDYNKMHEMWRKERVKYGKRADFLDHNENDHDHASPTF